MSSLEVQQSALLMAYPGKTNPVGYLTIRKSC